MIFGHRRNFKMTTADPSNNACIELLRPKTVPEGLIALGIVYQVSEVVVKFQIAGGVICLVDRFSISEAFSNHIENISKSGENLHSIPRLSQLFTKGQQYVCKIIEKRTRKGYADALDMIATLNPASLQEDVLPRKLLEIPNVPLQCAVQSIEDHGYQMDIGFKGLKGFLAFQDAEKFNPNNPGEKKLIIGQVVRCCSKQAFNLVDDVRVIHLSMTREAMKLSSFSQEKMTKVTLTPACVLPGSRSFLTVMKVTRDGLIVNFMNEFAGSVGIDHLADQWHHPKADYKISQQFKCTVLFYNCVTKTFALSIKKVPKFKAIQEYLLKNFYNGMVLTNVQVSHLNGTRSIVFKVQKNYKAISSARDAFDEDISTMTRDELLSAIDSKFTEGSIHTCRIKSINLVDQLIVVNLRQEFLDQPHISAEELKPGDFIEATVTKHVRDGVILKFGLNLRAILLNQDLNDYVSLASLKKYPIGKEIKCRILKVDLISQPPKIYLTNKQQLMDPGLRIIDSYDRNFKSVSTLATVTKIKPDGLIVELFNNVKGYIPRRFLSSVTLKNIDGLFKVGQVVPCVVYKADPTRPSLFLGVISFKDIMRMKREKKEFKKNKKEEKKIEIDIRHFNEKTKSAPKISKKPPRNESKSKSKSESESESESDIVTPELREKQLADVSQTTTVKSRRQRSEEARLREEKLREAENMLLDQNRPPLSIPDFERLLLKSPNSADAWIKYSKFFLENIETEKARIVCRRALNTIGFRLEKEKLKIWLHLIKIEAKFGGSERLRSTVEEAAQTNDRLSLYRGAIKVLISCNELDEAERLLEIMLKENGKSIEVWSEYILFHMEHRKDLTKARSLFDKACKSLLKSDLVILKSKFAQFEFKHGDVERGKTIFENLLSDNPKRTDLWRVYEAMINKFGTRQVDNDDVREQNNQALKRIADSIDTVSKKARKRKKV